MTTQSELLPLRLMARQLRVPARWLRSEAEAGRLPHIKAERAFLFDPEAVNRVLLQRADNLPDIQTTRLLWSRLLEAAERECNFSLIERIREEIAKLDDSNEGGAQ